MKKFFDNGSYEPDKTFKLFFNQNNTSGNTSSNTSSNTFGNSSNTYTSNYIIPHKKNDNCADFKYICIKKEHFDVNMIYLNYTNMKKHKYIEIIYKSPSVFLEGLFFKTPPILSSQIHISQKYRHNRDNRDNRDNIIIRITLDKELYIEFINMLKSVDEYIKNYITRFAKDINNEFFKNKTDSLEQNNTIDSLEQNNTIDSTESMNTIEMFRYENVLKYRSGGKCEINMKSYLDKHTLDNLYKKIANSKYIFTFNISNIYLGNISLLPLVKCNKCDNILLEKG